MAFAAKVLVTFDYLHGGLVMSRVSTAPKSPAPASVMAPPSTERIAMRAYELWRERGCPHGSDQQDWYQAERELLEASQPIAMPRRR
jgi:hypothetical protein